MRRLAVVAAALALAGCTSSTAPTSSGNSAPKAIRAHLAPCPAATGRLASTGLPDVTLGCLSTGPAVRLAGLRGPALVNIWASWCAPCLTELPELQRLHVAAGDRLTMLGVATDDDRRQALAAAAGLGVRFPSLFDRSGSLRRSLGLPGPPVTLLVDSDGRVVERIPGPVPALPELIDLIGRRLDVRP